MGAKKQSAAMPTPLGWRRRPIASPGHEFTDNATQAGILPKPGANDKVQTFGHGFAACKPLPPGARMAPIQEQTDLAPEERFRSVTMKDFVDASKVKTARLPVDDA